MVSVFVAGIFGKEGVGRRRDSGYLLRFYMYYRFGGIRIELNSFFVVF